MAYTALKTVRLFGKDYLPGEMVPEGAVLASRERTLIKSGYLAKQETVAQGGKFPAKEAVTAEIPGKEAAPKKTAKKRVKKREDV